MYWIAVASRAHVLQGQSGGFIQVCHGKAGPLKKMTAGDWIVYYSPTEHFGEPGAYRKFTAIGQIQQKAPYLYQMSTDFVPWRRDVHFVSAKEVAIEPLIPQLEFILNKKNWGFSFRRGCFKVSEQDFKLIAGNMGVTVG